MTNHVSQHANPIPFDNDRAGEVRASVRAEDPKPGIHPVDASGSTQPEDANARIRFEDTSPACWPAEADASIPAVGANTGTPPADRGPQPEDANTTTPPANPATNPIYTDTRIRSMLVHTGTTTISTPTPPSHPTTTTHPDQTTTNPSTVDTNASTRPVGTNAARMLPDHPTTIPQPEDTTSSTQRENTSPVRWSTDTQISSSSRNPIPASTPWSSRNANLITQQGYRSTQALPTYTAPCPQHASMSAAARDAQRRENGATSCQEDCNACCATCRASGWCAIL